MARSQALNEQMRESRRALILETALELFGTHGFDRTSIRMIAEAAGISQGLLYNYFTSKDEVLAAIFDQSMRDVQQSFTHAEAGATPAERIERLVHGAFDIVRGNQSFWRLSYSLRMQPGVLGSLAKRTRKSTALIQSTLAQYLRDAGADAPELEAAILFAVIDGVSQHFVLDPSRYPIDAVADRVIQRFTPGASRHAGKIPKGRVTTRLAGVATRSPNAAR